MRHAWLLRPWLLFPNDEVEAQQWSGVTTVIRELISAINEDENDIFHVR